MARLESAEAFLCVGGSNPAFWLSGLLRYRSQMTAIDFRGLANADASLSNQESLNRPPHLWRFGALKVLE
jgi:hypothetical protein